MLIFDIEIEKAILKKGEVAKSGINYCAGFHDFSNMGISCIGVFDMETDRTRVFLRDNLDEFQLLISRTDLMVGYNNKNFDNRLLIANGLSMPVNRSYDILEEIWKSLGIGTTFNPATHGGLSLDAVAYANLRCKKTGSGAAAPIDWQEGRKGSVIDYCLADVELTRRLLDKIIRTGKLKNPKTGEMMTIQKPH